MKRRSVSSPPSRRIIASSRFGPSVEWQDLPIVGARNDQRFRARAWRMVLIGLVLFWTAVIVAAFRALG